MARPTVQINAALNLDEYEALKDLCVRHGRTKAGLIKWLVVAAAKPMGLLWAADEGLAVELEFIRRHYGWPDAQTALRELVKMAFRHVTGPGAGQLPPASK